MKTISNINIPWRGKSLEYRKIVEPSSKKEEGGYRDSYKVFGFKNGKSYEPILKKFQKNCRAFLRGTEKNTGIKGLSKIIFAK